MAVGRVLEQIERDFEGPHLARLTRYLSQPSVSALDWGVREMAGLLAEDIRSLGGTAEVVETAELPVVFGRVGDGAPKTLLFHGLYDVTPADEPGWVIAPFEPEIREIEGVGRCVIGRGAEDMKTPIAAVMNVLASLQACGERLPVDVMFVLEASELGSGGIKEFVPRFADELREADLVHWLCPMARPDGQPIVPLALKGNLMGRLVCRAGDWGGPVDNELHALHSNWVGNPATRLAGAISHIEGSLEQAYIDGEGWRPSEAQRALVESLALSLDPDEMKRTLGVRRLRHDDFRRALDAHLFAPQFTVTGLQAGFVISAGGTARGWGGTGPRHPGPRRLRRYCLRGPQLLRRRRDSPGTPGCEVLSDNIRRNGMEARGLARAPHRHARGAMDRGARPSLGGRRPVPRERKACRQRVRAGGRHPLVREIPRPVHGPSRQIGPRRCRVAKHRG